jgi:uncharacterized membrane protein
VNNSLRGILWSALVFPGSGQFVLKHRKRGILFAVFAFCCAIALIVTVAAGTWKGLEDKAENGEDINLQAMFASAFSGVRNAEVFVLPPLFLCWLASVLDAGRLGKLMDEDQRVKTQTSDQGV